MQGTPVTCPSHVAALDGAGVVVVVVVGRVMQLPVRQMPSLTPALVSVHASPSTASSEKHCAPKHTPMAHGCGLQTVNCGCPVQSDTRSSVVVVVLVVDVVVVGGCVVDVVDVDVVLVEVDVDVVLVDVDVDVDVDVVVDCVVDLVVVAVVSQNRPSWTSTAHTPATPCVSRQASPGASGSRATLQSPWEQMPGRHGAMVQGVMSPSHDGGGCCVVAGSTHSNSTTVHRFEGQAAAGMFSHGSTTHKDPVHVQPAPDVEHDKLSVNCRQPSDGTVGVVVGVVVAVELRVVVSSAVEVDVELVEVEEELEVVEEVEEVVAPVVGVFVVVDSGSVVVDVVRSWHWSLRTSQRDVGHSDA